MGAVSSVEAVRSAAVASASLAKRHPDPLPAVAWPVRGFEGTPSLPGEVACGSVDHDHPQRLLSPDSRGRCATEGSGRQGARVKNPAITLATKPELPATAA